MILRVSFVLAMSLAIASAIPAHQTLFVGQFYQLSFTTKTTVTLEDGGPLPDWFKFENDILQGIPTENDLGTIVIQISSEGNRPYKIPITVRSETEGACGDEDTYFIEAYFEKENNITNRVEAALNLMEQADKKTLRTYSRDYARQCRTVENLMSERAPGDFVVLWKAACDDFDEATDVLNDFIEREDIDYDNVIMTKGRYNKNNKDLEPTTKSSPKTKATTPTTTTKTTTEAKTTITEKIDDEITKIAMTVEQLRTTTELIRTTRKISDNKPVLLNRIPLFTCIRGEICELRVSPETFKDVEDGDTFKLKLSIVALENADIWMHIDHNKGMIGVPMSTGEYSYRLEARDNAGQMASAPFSVIVKPSIPANHKIQFDMDMPSAQILATRPQTRNMFMRAMARALKAPVTSFTLHEITTKKNKTVVTWSNNTLPSQFCDEPALNAMVAKMIIKQKSRTKTEFVKAMGNNFYVRRVSMERLRNCEPDVEVSTTAPTIQSVAEADSEVIIIGVLTFFIIFLVCGIIVYFCCLKGKGKKDKANNKDYVSKGMPVVFPDEVEENDPATAGTPMLAREERPPLKVSQHENPLYKPPPPIANSPRLGQSASSSGQRLPPPFIPP
ncbi:unnamed protein product [Caenorhabditis bovis]|uniref:Dystroglycan 1 n=1 Tax=Caenorhabditis bovis TaxID=2654633 RepID=A0A8S1E813_9PELO|nr:unnamed protein product [Caenorhabditis bovis]